MTEPAFGVSDRPARVRSSVHIIMEEEYHVVENRQSKNKSSVVQLAKELPREVIQQLNKRVVR